MKGKLLIIGSFLISAVTIQANDLDNDKYSNPVIHVSMPDPTIIKGDDGYYYVYATENVRNVPIYKSTNLVDWTFVSTAFTDETRPNFVPEGRIWAPDINKIGNKYVMYYSMSEWGGEWTCGIGCAVADRPEGPFKDMGKMFRSNEIMIKNCIDPFYIEEDGKKYLFFGSFRGIYYVELENDGLSIKKDFKPVQIAGTAYEGTYIYKRGNYYYFFASIGKCCEGLRSTYKTVVGRSKNLFGPYLNKNGEPMLDNRHMVVIDKNEMFVGPGHNSEIIKDDKGDEWLLYHAVYVNEPDGRMLMLDKLYWDDGWPYVLGGQPSVSFKKPFFKK